jgi:putative membrane protein
MMPADTISKTIGVVTELTVIAPLKPGGAAQLRETLSRLRLAYSADEARKVAPIVANAGLYNGFLAAGLLWGLLSTGDDTAIKLFFLACVLAAGIFGVMTLKWTTLLLLAGPAALALLAIWMSTTP